MRESPLSALTAIHHVAIIVADYARSKSFYTDVLGFKVIREVYRGERQSYKLDLQVNETSSLEIFSFPHPPPRPSYPEACGLRHLAFSLPEIEPFIDHLKDNGITCESIRIDEWTGRRYTFFHDPDGLPIELYEANDRE